MTVVEIALDEGITRADADAVRQSVAELPAYIHQPVSRARLTIRRIGSARQARVPDLPPARRRLGARGGGMYDEAITGVMALGPSRGAVATLEHVLALPDFAEDAIVIVGDLDDYPGKRETYRRLFTTLGRARRGVLWAPGPVDGALAREVRWAYESAWPLPPSEARGSKPTNDLLGELMRTFKPRLAARVARPAVYLVRERERPQWLEL